MTKMEPIKASELKQLEQEYAADQKAAVVRHALNRNDISTISSLLEASAQNPNLFSIDIKTMPVTNQMSSGRCWIFSSLNVMREIIAKNCNIDDFELSQNYVAFYDKLEKVNFFLECMLQELKSPLSSETMRYLLSTGIGDGGQWDMLVSIIKKYGICPKSAMQIGRAHV